VRSLLCPLFALSALVQPATEEAGTSGESGAMASVLLLGVGSAGLSVGEHDR
jgi:hypothetical protein